MFRSADHIPLLFPNLSASSYTFQQPITNPRRHKPSLASPDLTRRSKPAPVKNITPFSRTHAKVNCGVIGVGRAAPVKNKT
jgi:hypothetical protein